MFWELNKFLLHKWFGLNTILVLKGECSLLLHEKIIEKNWLNSWGCHWITRSACFFSKNGNGQTTPGRRSRPKS